MNAPGRMNHPKWANIINLNEREKTTSNCIWEKLQYADTLQNHNSAVYVLAFKQGTLITTPGVNLFELVVLHAKLSMYTDDVDGIQS